jgi:hypothetical protein
MNRHHSPRVKLYEYRMQQRQSQSAGIPSAFVDLFTAQDPPLAVETLANQDSLPTTTASDAFGELAPGIPMWRWNPGKYNRHATTPAVQPSRHQQLIRRWAAFGASTLLLSVIFAAVGV